MRALSAPIAALSLCSLLAAGAGQTMAVAISDSVAKGEAIVREWERRDQGFEDSESVMTMVLENRNGQTSERRLRVQTLEVTGEDDGDKSLIVFDEPRDVKGTALLSFSHILDADEQWIYLPALKRVKRIASNNKSGPFVGSEFAYEDLVAQEFPKYEYQWLRDEPCGELECHVVQQTPRYDNSGYSHQHVWYDTSMYRQQRVVFYDRKGEVLKTLELSDYRQYLSRFWRAHRLEMVNHQSGKRTALEVEELTFQTGLRDSDFTRKRLERVR